MIFNDISTLHDFILFGRSNFSFRDEDDPEVDKHLSSSPSINDLLFSFENEVLREEKEHSISFDLEDEYDVGMSGEVEALSDHDRESTIASHNSTTTTIPISKGKSSLTYLLELQKNTSSTFKNDSNKIKLTIYLPDYTSMMVTIDEMDTVSEVLKKILKTHRKENKSPKLYYKNPDIYEIRMHEGDGEPDKDFPALEKKNNWKQLSLDECCLCEKDNISPAELLNKTNEIDEMDSDDEEIEDETMVTVHIQGATQVKLPFDDNSTLKSLLPQIVENLAQKGHKLSLYTEELSFLMTVTAEEQDRRGGNTSRAHKSSSSGTSRVHLPLDTNIKSLGIWQFELQKRTYADSGRNNAKRTPNVQIGGTVEVPKTLGYQEWNVIKRNRFGKRQERVIGIDSSMVYNSKREKAEKTFGMATVARAERPVNSIKKVEVVTGPQQDKKTFRITWEEDKGQQVYDIEYTCESEQDCAEIVTKLNYLVNSR